MDDDEHVTFDEDPFLFTILLVISFGLTCMAGLMSGLTLGLMSMDATQLEVLRRTGTPQEQNWAGIIIPVIKNQHLLLVTLLLCNACASEALPLFLDKLADPVTAVVLSVTVVLIFGEIIPQAICSRYGLQVGAYSAWFVNLLMTITYPISYPIGKLLDSLLGSDHSALFRRAELKALVDVHGRTAGFGGTLSKEEIHIISGALDLTQKTALESMTPLDRVFMICADDRIDERALHNILLSGHSRIPVHRHGNRKDIIGILLAKELVLVNTEDNLRARDLCTRDLPRLLASTPMYDVLQLFETGKSHMAILVKPTNLVSSVNSSLRASEARRRMSMAKQARSLRLAQGRLGGGGGTDECDDYDDAGGADKRDAEMEVIGIITIEDVIEELLQEEIYDEMDDMEAAILDKLSGGGPQVVSTLPPRLRHALNAGGLSSFTPRIGRLAKPL